MTIYYKAVRPDGTSFHDSTFRWLPPAGEPLPDKGLLAVADLVDAWLVMEAER